MSLINPELVKLARYTVGKQNRQKQAFQPPQDPSQQGGPPGGDPSQGGGAPPGMPPGMPPMDPSQGGMPPGMPPGMPMDPSMMGGGAGGPVPGAGGMTADTIRQVMQETLGQMGMVPGQAGPGGGAAGGKPGKPDLLAMSMDIFQIKKMMSTLFNSMGIPMPQDILDGPNRDPATGAPMMPNAPGSTSDPTRVSPPAGGGPPGGGQDSAIKPIGQMGAALPGGGGPPGGGSGGGGGGGGGGKTAADRLGQETTQLLSREVRNKAAALRKVLQQRQARA